MSKIEINKKFLEVAKLLGFTTVYFSGMFRVRFNGEYIGEMSAEAWLDHLKNCMLKSQRSQSRVAGADKAPALRGCSGIGRHASKGFDI